MKRTVTIGAICEYCDRRHDEKEASLARQHARYMVTRRNGGVAPVALHNYSTYINWGCRCVPCTTDNTQKCASRRENMRG